MCRFALIIEREFSNRPKNASPALSEIEGSVPVVSLVELWQFPTDSVSKTETVPVTGVTQIVVMVVNTTQMTGNLIESKSQIQNYK